MFYKPVRRAVILPSPVHYMVHKRTRRATSADYARRPVKVRHAPWSLGGRIIPTVIIARTEVVYRFSVPPPLPCTRTDKFVIGGRNVVILYTRIVETESQTRERKRVMGKIDFEHTNIDRASCARFERACTCAIDEWKTHFLMSARTENVMKLGWRRDTWRNEKVTRFATAFVWSRFVLNNKYACDALALIRHIYKQRCYRSNTGTRVYVFRCARGRKFDFLEGGRVVPRCLSLHRDFKTWQMRVLEANVLIRNASNNNDCDSRVTTVLT